MDNKEIAEHLKTIMSKDRYVHTIGVAQTAVKMADIYGADGKKAETAALLHDIARDFSSERILEMCRKHQIALDEIEKAVPDLLHGKVGACLAEEQYDIKDREILDAIRFHTTGRKKMSVLEKIIFIADKIEPTRDFSGVGQLRELAARDLDAAVVAGFDSTIRYVLEQGLLLHPNGIDARNDFLISREAAVKAGTYKF